MSTFDQMQEQLNGARRDIDRQRQVALLAREAVRRAELALAESARTDSPRGKTDRARLEEALKTARSNSDAANSAMTRLIAAEQGLVKQFTPVNDPRSGLSNLTGTDPILLLPLRLETRFKTDGAGQPQIWVRVYPDSCLVDTFEESLTDQEVTNARRFWGAVWRAGGDEPLERAAWRDLVAAHGSGRSGWIVRTYVPLNPGDKPHRENQTDILLISMAPGPLPAAAAAYWLAIWKGTGDGGVVDPAVQQGAYNTLKASVGDAQAADIVQNFQPFNLSDAPVAGQTRADVLVKTAVLQLTPPEEMTTRRSSWSSAPHVDLLPDRFVFIGYGDTGDPLVQLGNPVLTPLIAGPDPNAPPAQQLKPVNDTLQIPDDMAWMYDFDRAIEVGMGLRVNLTPALARGGFRRVIVLGVRLSDSSRTATENFSRLLEHHLRSRTGLEIIPQGTPTNNTEKGGSGYSFRDDPDATFDLFFRNSLQYTPESDPLKRQDGEWLARFLGLSDDLVQQIPNAGGTDQVEARAMQIALWPGTLGYMMKTLLAPVFSDTEIDATRSFFTRYVSGRGPLPVLRIGKQPYGILPATAFERITWFSPEDQKGFPGRLYNILQRMESDWKALLGNVSYIGKQGGDPHQILLDVLGLHPDSAEYYPLQADSMRQKFYESSLLDPSFAMSFLGLFPSAIPLSLLRSFGYEGAAVPDILNKVFRARQTPLNGPVVDDRPLSETNGIRTYAGDRNYIGWLIDAAQSGIARLQQEDGFDGDVKPAALLYLMLRNALQISFFNTGTRLKVEAGLVAASGDLYREPDFVHVQEAQSGSESRYESLFRPEQLITGQPDLLLGDHIAHNIHGVDTGLGEQIDALGRLAPLATSRLERVFAEHVDTTCYRLDAWKTGLMTARLEQMRTGSQGKGNGGLFLGAYGWLEPLRPKNNVLTPALLPEDLAGKINLHDKTPLMQDSTNEGLIHAPSLNHATTAAVLRSGYSANEGRLAVNLSSRRVRRALDIMEGMRNGQSIGALLGYQFERYVFDNGPLQVLDLIYPMRRAFPLAANQIESTATTDGDARDSIAAMNVVDGRKLIEHAEGGGGFVYPFDVPDLPRRTPDQESALTDALAYIRDVNDGVADLALAEGVHQAVLGNYDRSAGTLDAFAKGSYPPEPDVIRTPRSGIALTLRTAIHLSPDPPANPLPLIPLTPLSIAEPALNAWLKGRLPSPDDVGCNVSFTSRTTNLVETAFITQSQLGLHPIDLLYRMNISANQGVTDLDDRILRYLHANMAPRLEKEIRINYTDRVNGKVTWFELQALLQSLRSLTVSSRPLQPADLMRHNDASSGDQAAVSLPEARVQVPRDELVNTHIPALASLTAALGGSAVTIDDALSQYASTVGLLAAYRLPQTGIGFMYEWRAGVYSTLVNKVSGRMKVWEDHIARYNEQINNYDNNLPPGTTEEGRIALLRGADILIGAHMIAPPPVNSHDYRLALGTKLGNYMTKRDALKHLVDVARPTLAGLLTDANNQLPLADFDPEPFDFNDDAAEVARFRKVLLDTVALLSNDIAKRIAGVDSLLAGYSAAGPAGGVKILQDSAKILFGEDFQLVPLVTLPPDAALELANAWQHTTSGALTNYLTDPTKGGRDFPVDDWMHGVARVRDKMHQWENAVILGEAFDADQAGDLTPLQIPFGPAEPWLALEIPPDYKITGDRLLYTAHFAGPFDATKPVCGLLVDEWTEVIPAAEETTGIAFNFDRPNSEPPQSWLLALPAGREVSWMWDDLLSAVNNSLDSAKLRAIEPVHLEETAYSWFLPATMSPYTYPEISISNNLLRNVKIYSGLKEA
jgi:hypothetical protein